MPTITSDVEIAYHEQALALRGLDPGSAQPERGTTQGNNRTNPGPRLSTCPGVSDPAVGRMARGHVKQQGCDRNVVRRTRRGASTA